MWEFSMASLHGYMLCTGVWLHLCLNYLLVSKLAHPLAICTDGTPPLAHRLCRRPSTPSLAEASRRGLSPTPSISFCSLMASWSLFVALCVGCRSGARESRRWTMRCLSRPPTRQANQPLHPLWVPQGNDILLRILFFSLPHCHWDWGPAMRSNRICFFVDTLHDELLSVKWVQSVVRIPLHF